MADEFDRFLASSLAPPERLSDRGFVAGVKARIMLEDRLARERRAFAHNLVSQLIALCAVAAALWVFGRAGPVAEWFARSPDLGLAILATAFALVVAIVSRPGRSALRMMVIS